MREIGQQEEAPMTERGEYTFRVKDFENGRFWIAAEPLKGLKRINGLLSFDLVEGMTLEKAREIAKLMNDNIRSISLTP